MKFTAIFAAIMSVALITADCSAQPPGRQRGSKGAKPGAERGERGERGSQGRGAGASQQRDPAEMAARMMKEFDKDGDSKLSSRELMALLTSMRDRRSSGDAGAAAGQRMGKGQRPEGAGQGGPKAGGPKAGGKGGKGKGADQAGTPGGQKPKRPKSN